MKPLDSDTPPKVERLHLQLLREAGPKKRLALACSLTRTAFALSWRAHRQRHPQMPEDELQLRFVEHLYGADLAQRLRTYLVHRGQ